MIWLILSISFSSLVVLLFKVFEKKGVDTFQGIVVNYGVCFLMGTLFSGAGSRASFMEEPWILYTLLLGILFITVFNAIGWVAQQVAVSASMVAAKMSLLIPVLFSVLVWGDELKPLQAAGILLALAALYMVTRREEQVHGGAKAYVFILLVFLGSGTIDTLMKFIQVNYLATVSVDRVLSAVFGMAFCSGLLVFLFRLIRGTTKPGMKHVLGGIVLGVPNYFSMYFLFRALHQEHMPAAYIFPLNNIAIVLVSTLAAMLFFAERTSRLNKAGLLLALFSILFMSLV